MYFENHFVNGLHLCPIRRRLVNALISRPKGMSMNIDSKRWRVAIAGIVGMAGVVLLYPVGTRAADDTVASAAARTLIDVGEPDGTSIPQDGDGGRTSPTNMPPPAPTSDRSSDKDEDSPDRESVETDSRGGSTTAAPRDGGSADAQSVLKAGCQTYPPTSFQVCGRIRDKYNQTGGPAGFLLFPKSNELTNPGATGKRSEFIGGNIYWSANTDAHPVAHEFLSKWAKRATSLAT